MKFKDYVKEDEEDNTDGETADLGPEENEISDDDKDEMNSADAEVGDEEMDDEDSDETDEDDDTADKISDLLPRILSGTFKTLEEIKIPLQDFLDNSGIEQDDLQFWIDNAGEVYPDLTHELEIDGDDLIIREVGIEDDEDSDEDDSDETDEDEDDEDEDDNEDDESDEDFEDEEEGK